MPKSQTNIPNLIDCTFRDGGYYTNWFFEKSLVEKTLSVLAEIPIAYVEIGFRKFANSEKSGPLAYTSDEYIAELAIPEKINLAVMVMLKEFDHLESSCLAKLFCPADQSRIQLIRIAAPVKDIAKVAHATRVFKDQGYKVANNITHVSAASDPEIAKCFEQLHDIKPDIVTLADTFGTLVPSRVRQIFKSLCEHFQGEYGFHAHDNCGLALTNTLAAIDTGATWVDATIMGMGRGAGNLKLESVLLDLQAKKPDMDLRPLLRLVESDFSDLIKRYRWGYNHLYHYGTNAGVHPMVLQNLLSDPSVNFESLLDALKDTLVQKLTWK